MDNLIILLGFLVLICGTFAFLGWLADKIVENECQDERDWND